MVTVNFAITFLTLLKCCTCLSIIKPLFGSDIVSANEYLLLIVLL